jgi:hypothetical protein
MSFAKLKEKTKWLCLASGVIFLATSTYMRMKFVFESGSTGGLLLLLALITALITLILGVVSLPRWQGFVALAISVYAIYWLSGPTYAIS